MLQDNHNQKHHLCHVAILPNPSPRGPVVGPLLEFDAHTQFLLLTIQSQDLHQLLKPTVWDAIDTAKIDS